MSESSTSAPARADGAAAAPVYASRRERRAAEAAAGTASTRRASAKGDAQGEAREPAAARAETRRERRIAEPPAAASSPPAPRALRDLLGQARRAVAAGGVMMAAAALAIGMTVPPTALSATAPSAADEPTIAEPAATEPPSVQVAIAGPAKPVATAPAERDAWTGDSSAALQMAAFQASGFGYAPGFIPTTGSIRWPFPVSASMSSGFGEYRGDSTHNGLDFNPGIGSPIQAIADGVVTWVGWKSNYGYGYYATVEHVINGVTVESLYGHMIDGSSPLVIGQTISVGDTIGLVGNTGYSTGPHLHLEIRVSGTPVDPYYWLTENATNR